jgi:hypothetical protein
MDDFVPVPVGDELPPLPDPFEIEWPVIHSNGLGCGVEDRGITCRYEAAAYGWQEGIERAFACVPENIFDADMMHDYARAAVLADRQSRLVDENYRRCHEIQQDELMKANARVSVLERERGELVGAIRFAKNKLVPVLDEPGRTAFWRLVEALAKAESGK